jgi:5-formyltetrahydrofolate cyclo-ligase
MTRKQALREQVQRRLAGLDPRARAAASDAVQRRVLSLSAFAAATGVACYLALPGEVDTRGVIRACRARGKRVCVPVYDRARRGYFMAWYEEDAALVRGPHGVAQPAGAPPAAAAAQAVQLVLVPGLAFSPAGARLGRGGGHYDRLLAAWASAGACRAGLGFEAQILDEIPTEQHDVGMDLVITETHEYGCCG